MNGASVTGTMIAASSPRPDGPSARAWIGPVMNPARRTPTFTAVIWPTARRKRAGRCVTSCCAASSERVASGIGAHDGCRTTLSGVSLLSARSSAWLVAGLASAVLPVLIALNTPTASLKVAGLVACGAAVLVVMFVSARYELTLLAYGAYLALFDGSLRLATGIGVFTVIRDILLLAIVAGAVMRLVVSRARVKLP